MGVGLYVRISDDVEGHGLGVGRQEQDGRTVADLRGWPVERVYCDNDYSAFKAGVVRPEFERLLADLDDGAIDGIVTYDLDRFARQPADLERAIAIYDRRPSLVFATVQGDVNLETPDGRTMARVMVAFANKASMDTSRRVRRKHLELAQKGVPVGGHRPFGYQADKVTIEPTEAELVRQAAKDILTGVGLHTIARRWNDAGVTTTAGNPWRRSVLKAMMLSPRLAGFRVYRGGIALDEQGEPVTGLYPALLDIEMWEAVCAVLTDPARGGRHVHVGGRKYLLSGIVRCSRCSTLLVGNADRRWNTFHYHCPSPTNGGCGKVSVSGPKTDRLVTDLVLHYLDEREVQRDAAPWPGEPELSAITARIGEMMDRYADGDLSGDVVFPTVTKLETQATRLRAEQREWLREQVAITHRPTNATESWRDLDTDQQRSLMQSVLHAVIVRSAAHRGGRFDPDRIEPVWR